MILVTGGTGLLGSHLLYALASKGEKIRALKRESSNLEEVKKVFSCYPCDSDKLFNRIEWQNADLTVPESIGEALDEVNRVYHAAAYVSFDPRDRKKIIENNRLVTASLVNACLEKKDIRFLHVSSTSALGAAINGEEVRENIIWTPGKMNTGYSVSKFLSEMEVWRGMEENLDALIVNPSIILGPGFWHKGSSSMFSNIKKGLRFYMNGVTGYVGVEDAVKCMIALMDSTISHERFILSAENLSYKEIFTLIASEMKVKAPSIEATPLLAGLAWRLDAFRSLFGGKRVITRETVRAGRSKVFFSNEKIKNQLGYEFESIKEVIRKTVRAFEGW